MMSHKSFVFIAMAVVTAFTLLSNCRGATEPSDEENLKNLIDNEYAAYFNDDASWQGGDPGDVGALPPGAADAAATLPQGWYRAVEYYARTFTVTVGAPYTKADVVVKDDVRGKMYIDRTANYVWDPNTKPFDVEATRYATFERATTEDPWVLTAISPLVFRCKEEGQQTVTITEVKIEGEHGFARVYTDFTTPIPLAELPTFQTGEKITVTCKGTNTSTEGWEPVSFAFVHHDRTRDNMTDLGEQSYEKKYTVQYNAGVHHGGISLIDAGTLQNETEDDYNADGWSIPYRIQ